MEMTHEEGRTGRSARRKKLALDTEQLQRPGSRLLAALFQQANYRDHSLAALANELGCTPGYLSQLRNDTRCATNVSQKFVDAAARYLGVLPVIVKILAEQVRAEDFVMPSSSLESRLDQVMQFIRDDGAFGASVPGDILSASREMKIFVIECYREATGLDLTPGISLTRRLRDTMEAALVFDNEVKPHQRAAQQPSATGIAPTVLEVQ
ncbi:helix-turn-helix domain-containing protein [Paraburkholderia sp. NPDC080076]|uniref:helix-turn-helix domain-containing protein n=1 Tax=Paraburkholderia sp. NPDC080076 TaxID=3390605 RepID=UPI003CFDF8DB